MKVSQDPNSRSHALAVRREEADVLMSAVKPDHVTDTFCVVFESRPDIRGEAMSMFRTLTSRTYQKCELVEELAPNGAKWTDPLFDRVRGVNELCPSHLLEDGQIIGTALDPP